MLRIITTAVTKTINIFSFSAKEEDRSTKEDDAAFVKAVSKVRSK